MASGAKVALFILPLLFTPSMMIISGHSATDPWDRIVSVTYHGVEVARVITPDRVQGPGLSCVPQDGLCNWFSLETALPFVPGGSLAVQGPAQWSFISSAAAWSSPRVVSLIPSQRVISGQELSFSVPEWGSVYFLLSGHDECENASPDAFQVDGHSHPFLNWSYGAGPERFTLGVVIPYETLHLAPGLHTFSADCGGSGQSYILASAFTVLDDPPGALK